MIIILDDTFGERHKFNDVEYLYTKEYQKICEIFTRIKTTEIKDIIKLLPKCEAFFNHRTLQLYDNGNQAVNNDDNIKLRDSIINKVSESKISRIEFSRGVETSVEANRLDKDLFYTNLKPFLDYYLERNSIQPKILFWGENFEETEKMSVIQNMLMELRTNSFESYAENKLILTGLALVYPNQLPKVVIDKWKESKLSRALIINEINNQLL